MIKMQPHNPAKSTMTRLQSTSTVPRLSVYILLVRSWIFIFRSQRYSFPHLWSFRLLDRDAEDPEEKRADEEGDDSFLQAFKVHSWSTMIFVASSCYFVPFSHLLFTVSSRPFFIDFSFIEFLGGQIRGIRQGSWGEQFYPKQHGQNRALGRTAEGQIRRAQDRGI